MKKRRLFHFVVSLLITGSTLGLGSCGIEDYPYLDPVDSGIPLRLNTTAFIRLPDFSGNIYFRTFVIYYRIYISGLSIPGTVSTSQMYQINSSLTSDYNAMLSYTDTSSTTTAPSNMGSVFSNRRYYTLALENASIDNVLGSAGGGVITLDFADTSGRPSLIIGDTRMPSNNPYARYRLFRYSESGFMRPYADNRYFVNSNDINNGAYINTATYTNLDVQYNSASGYTYVSMYILAYGVDSNFSNIYSTPTFIGVFRLPD
ncbi:hypothetical protein AGMMS49942_07780 [Spirochaetia bacterium]|nr:hypothetical protein AGMMS49942_07780 [Spirochaetia bacterium]